MEFEIFLHPVNVVEDIIDNSRNDSWKQVKKRVKVKDI
jgi:hypothetical protein